MITLPALIYFCESRSALHPGACSHNLNHVVNGGFKLNFDQNQSHLSLGGRMAKESTFDIVSEVDKQEVANAVNQAAKEIHQRYDFKDTGATIEHTDNTITLTANAADRGNGALDVLQSKLVRRGVSLHALNSGEPVASGKQQK